MGTLHIELLHGWEILITEIPVIYNNLMTTLMKTELWKVLHGLVMEVINALPIDLITKYWTILKAEITMIFNNFMATLKTTELWKILTGMVNEIMARYPAVFNILVDFHNKVILTTVPELQKLVSSILALPTFSFRGLWDILKTEVPAVIANPKTQLLATDLVKFILMKLQELRPYFPTVVDFFVDVWGHIIVPVYTDLVTLLNKLMTMKFTSVWEVIDLLVV